MLKKEVVKFIILRTLGNFFILFTLFGFFATFGPALYYEALFRISTYQGIHFRLAAQSSELEKLIREHTPAASPTPEPATRQENLLGAILSGQKEHILIPKSTDFAIVIPKIGASAVVFPNTDPSRESEYLPVLQKGVAHAKGSAFPGMNGNIYLFAHSADTFWNVGRYNAVFYLLKELEVGDQVVVFFQKKRFDYVVYDKKIVNAEEVSHINANIGSGELLTLQTCWPPGTSWKRLLVFAKPRGR